MWTLEQQVLKSAMLSTHIAGLGGFIVGVLVHHQIFAYGEWHLVATHLLKGHCIVWTILTLGLSYFATPLQAIKCSSILMIAYAAGIFSSITVYRLLLHRLRGYPGPVLARVTKLWHVFQCRDSKNHLLMDRLYQKYGNYVRTGPSELTVFHPDVLYTIYDGQKNTFTKPAWYDNLRPYTGLNTHRSKYVHDHRRRIWDKGFSTKALQTYQPEIRAQADKLDAIISQNVGKAVDINPFFYWFSWDVMGQLAFSRSFDMLQDGKWHSAIGMLREGLQLVGPFTPVPWLTRIAFDIPFLSTVRNFLRMEDWCARRMDERIMRGGDGCDVSSYLIQWSMKHDRLKKDLHTLYGDAIALVIAGSDTVAFTLVYVFYYLCIHPSHVEKLRKEQEGVDLSDFRQLQALPHLNGVINEVLRLHPAVPTGGFRETPREGAYIGDKWVPGYTLICAPRWTLGRLESCWEKPLEFVPERWYSKPEMIRNKKAFAPFALGAYYCIGKNLAFMEMQYVISLLLSRYDIQLAPGETGYNVVNDMVDQFTASSGKLRVVFTRREER